MSSLHSSRRHLISSKEPRQVKKVVTNPVPPPATTMKLSLTLLLAVGLVAADDFLNVPVHDLVQEGDFPTKTQYKPNKPKKPCPTTLTVTAPVDCSGCTTTVYKSTATESVDCHGCKKLTSSTYYPPFAGLCPVSLVKDWKGGCDVC